MIDYISQPWHWSISGLMITLVMFLLLIFGGSFGASANLRTMCSICGAGTKHSFFDFAWKDQLWNLVFICSAIVGGFIAITFLESPAPVQISADTQDYLQSIGIATPSTIAEGRGFVPDEIFNLSQLFAPRNLLILCLGGFMVGFGARYAGGCTSGHAISGLSNFQLPSLIAVIGFFIGGLLMAWVILPMILTA